MIGIRGIPLTKSFRWAKWSSSTKKLLEMGADFVLTDEEARKRGFVVKAAKGVKRCKSIS